MSLYFTLFPLLVGFPICPFHSMFLLYHSFRLSLSYHLSFPSSSSLLHHTDIYRNLILLPNVSLLIYLTFPFTYQVCNLTCSFYLSFPFLPFSLIPHSSLGIYQSLTFYLPSCHCLSTCSLTHHSLLSLLLLPESRPLFFDQAWVGWGVRERAATTANAAARRHHHATSAIWGRMKD